MYKPSPRLNGATYSRQTPTKSEEVGQLMQNDRKISRLANGGAVQIH